MGNALGMFKKDPQDLPGQGLMRADNYNNLTAGNQYGYLLDQYNQGLGGALNTEEALAPRFASARLKTLGTTLNGTNGDPGLLMMYRDALRKADPESAALMDNLTQSASSDLALDNRLDENQAHQLEQSVRGGQAARGMGWGNTDVFQEMLAKTGYGDQLRQQRRGFANSIAQQRQQLVAQPAGLATNAMVSQQNPGMADPNQMWSTLNSVYGQNQANNRATATNETYMAGKYVDMMGKLMGMGMGG